MGTQTEVYEYLKLLFARIGRTFSPVSGVEVRRHSVSDVVDYIFSGQCSVTSDQNTDTPTAPAPLTTDHWPLATKILILAPLEDSKERPLRSQLDILRQEGYQRVMVKGTVVRIEDCLNGSMLDCLSDAASNTQAFKQSNTQAIYLVIDRVTVDPTDDGLRARVAESVQAAFFEGRGSCCISVQSPVSGDHKAAASTLTTDHWPLATFSNRFEADGITFEKPNPNFFSFNNPYGACPTCQGYGHVIGIDENLVVPNKSRSVYDNAIVCWNGDKMQDVKREFIRHAAVIDFPIHKPYYELTPQEKDILWHGDGTWEGIDGFFRWVESQSYKIQYRVMLSRYRGRTVCPDCHGHRLP